MWAFYVCIIISIAFDRFAKWICFKNACQKSWDVYQLNIAAPDKALIHDRLALKKSYNALEINSLIMSTSVGHSLQMC